MSSRTGKAGFEDFAAGQTFRSGTLRMDRARVIAFAEEFDPQPQHLGTESASGTLFGELVASGWHTAAAFMRLYVEALPPIAGGGQGVALDGLGWPNPDRGLVQIKAITRNQDDQIVQTATHTMMVPYRETPSRQDQ